MSRLPRVLEVEHLGEHRLRLTFSNGLVRELDFAGVIQGRGGVFEPLREPAFFLTGQTIQQTGCWGAARLVRRAVFVPKSSPRTAAVA